MNYKGGHRAARAAKKLNENFNFIFCICRDALEAETFDGGCYTRWPSTSD